MDVRCQTSNLKFNLSKNVMATSICSFAVTLFNDSSKEIEKLSFV